MYIAAASYLMCTHHHIVQPVSGKAPSVKVARMEPMVKTANVIYSEWIDVEWNGVNDPDFRRMGIEEPLVLEEDFMNHGTILVYFKDESDIGIQILQLPIVLGNTNLYFAIADTDDGTTVLQGLSVVSRSMDDNPALELDGNQIRYVLIPGGTHVNLKDYREVARAFNLKD